MKKQAVRLGILFVGWSLLAVFLATNRTLFRLTVGLPVDFVGALRPILLNYWIWAALTPAVFYLAQRFRFTRRTWARSLAIHFCGYLALSCLHEVGALALRLPVWIPDGFHGSLLQLRIVESLNEDLWMYWPIVVIWSLFEYYQRYRERDLSAAKLNTRLARAELQSLRNQLHPHFLFNTLNSITALIHEDVEAADDMLADLGHLLRAYLTDTDEQEITLGREIELLSTYVRIQQRRFEDRLSSTTDVDGDLLDAFVPSFVLQPLVENAILHGIAPRPGPGRVQVAAHRQGSNLLLEVTDDGVGLAPAYKEGVGLSNTRSRLLQLYGSGQAFHVQNNPGAGVVVRIVLPLRFAVSPSGIAKNEDSNRDRRRRTAGTPEDFVATNSRS